MLQQISISAPVSCQSASFLQEAVPPTLRGRKYQVPKALVLLTAASLGTKPTSWPRRLVDPDTHRLDSAGGGKQEPGEGDKGARCHAHDHRCRYGRKSLALLCAWGLQHSHACGCMMSSGFKHANCCVSHICGLGRRYAWQAFNGQVHGCVCRSHAPSHQMSDCMQLSSTQPLKCECTCCCCYCLGPRP